MENRLFCEYKFKFYLNASHSIIINGRQGEVHPHTWEFVLEILVPRDEFLEFRIYEEAVERFFNQFQNRTINEVEPFDAVVPTLENMLDYFGGKLRSIIQKRGGALMQIEGSETPTRSYVISYTRDSEYLSSVEQYSEDSLSRILDKMLDDIIQ